MLCWGVSRIAEVEGLQGHIHEVKSQSLSSLIELALLSAGLSQETYIALLF